ncbi:LLM class flavin-dependent oxidoreductase [Pseudonocardia ailaonensis]|uniref:LLM class flavin-dependent oxidoreductase n=1 Tax=Pseudonocardia ailaonensis TaxID=367279 RepID=A0ABN2NEI6_9PSEU
MIGARIGLSVPLAHGTGAGRAQMAEWFARADASGLDSLWVLDQLIGRMPTPGPVGVLGFAAAMTERVRLGTAVYVVPGRNPIAAAKELATLDSLAGGGRLVVGVGSGNRAHFPTFGLGCAHDGPPAPRDVLDEFLEVLPRLWREADVHHPGPLWPMDGVTLSPHPAVPPALWVGGGAPAALRRALRFGSGWIGAGRHSTAEFAELAARFRALCAEAGRPDMAVGKRVYLLVEGDRARARATIEEWFGTFYRRPELGATVTVAGDAAECLEQLEALTAAGATDLILHPLAETAAQQDLVFDALLPALAGYRTAATPA